LSVARLIVFGWQFVSFTMSFILKSFSPESGLADGSAGTEDTVSIVQAPCSLGFVRLAAVLVTLSQAVSF
jgi:hypothetical protein